LGHVHPRINDGLWGCDVVSLKTDGIGPRPRPMDMGPQSESIRLRWCAPWPQPPGLRRHMGFDLTRLRVRGRRAQQKSIRQDGASMNLRAPVVDLQSNPMDFGRFSPWNHRRMSCVKVSSRLSLRWCSCRRRSCQLVPRTLRPSPRRRPLKLRLLPPSHLLPWPSFPARPSHPVRW
jgi:hypothetical protein